MGEGVEVSVGPARLESCLEFRGGENTSCAATGSETVELFFDTTDRIFLYTL